MIESDPEKARLQCVRSYCEITEAIQHPVIKKLIAADFEELTNLLAEPSEDPQLMFDSPWRINTLIGRAGLFVECDKRLWMRPELVESVKALIHQWDSKLPTNVDENRERTDKFIDKLLKLFELKFTQAPLPKKS